MANVAYVKTELSPDRPPPASETGIIGWMRQNLFSTWYNSLATLIVIYIFYSIIPGLVDWALLSPTWDASGREDCRVEGAGACWGFVKARFNFLMYGFYESDAYWRPNLVGLILLLAFIPVLFDKIPGRGICAAFLIFIFPWIATALLYGPIHMDTLTSQDGSPSVVGWAIYLVVLLGAAAYGWRARQQRNAGGTMLGFGIVYCVLVVIFLSWGFGLETMQTSDFGGLMLTLVIATVGIAASLPLGIVLALGRRADNMPAVQMLCIGFIELIRAVPLITVLFMAQFMLPLFLPEGATVDNLVRALVGFTLFSSAYMAEVVRGGLQAIPKGQFEAADAMGLNYAMSMRLVVLPQALKIVIPGIVSTFIGLFKDTTLVSIIGLMDMLLAAKASITDAKWLGLEHEAYIFVGIVYFVFCFGMSRYSIFLERKLHTGHKR